MLALPKIREHKREVWKFEVGQMYLRLFLHPSNFSPFYVSTVTCFSPPWSSTYPKAPTKAWMALSPITFLWKSGSLQNPFLSCGVFIFSLLPWATEENCFTAVVVICVFPVPENNSNLHLLRENMKILSCARERIKNDLYLRTQPITIIILMSSLCPFPIKIIFTILHFSLDFLNLMSHRGHILELCSLQKQDLCHLSFLSYSCTRRSVNICQIASLKYILIES